MIGRKCFLVPGTNGKVVVMKIGRNHVYLYNTVYGKEFKRLLYTGPHTSGRLFVYNRKNHYLKTIRKKHKRRSNCKGLIKFKKKHYKSQKGLLHRYGFRSRKRRRSKF